LVSLFADLASEMLYPVMPLFLDGIGMSAAGIGLLEGTAALVAGFGKVWFGSLSDVLQRRNIFIRLGYGLSAISKPIMGLFPAIWPVFFARLSDRVGKGMRGGARDAVLSSEAAPENRGKVFGFHRSMDTIGAVLGAGVALVWIALRPGDYQSLFLIAFVPGLISIVFTLLLPPDKPSPPKAKKRPFQGIFQFWKEAPNGYKRILVAGLGFALLNSSDILLLLRVGDSGMEPVTIVGFYIFYNIIYVLASYPFGGLADKIGFKKVYLLSILIYGGCYLGMAFATSWWSYVLIFGFYGCFAATNEGIVTAWLTHWIPKDKKGTGLGLFSFFETFAKFIASPMLGILWIVLSAEWAFGIAGGLTLILAMVFIFLLPRGLPVDKPAG
jgi:MFS family permease